jgi:hypothetical protein
MASQGAPPKPAVGLSELPRDHAGAATLLRNLGYKGALVFAVEVDRVCAVVNGKALTLRFSFNDGEEKVYIHREEGWPVD